MLDRVNLIDRAVHAIQVVIRAVGVAGGVAGEEAAEVGVVAAEAEVVNSKQFAAFFRAELTDVFGGSDGRGFDSPGRVAARARHCAVIIGQRAGRSRRVVQEVFTPGSVRIFRVNHVADAAAVAAGTHQISFQRTLGVILLHRHAAVVEITYRIAVFRLFKTAVVKTGGQYGKKSPISQ